MHRCLLVNKEFLLVRAGLRVVWRSLLPLSLRIVLKLGSSMMEWGHHAVAEHGSAAHALSPVEDFSVTMAKVLIRRCDL